MSSTIRQTSVRQNSRIRLAYPFANCPVISTNYACRFALCIREKRTGSNSMRRNEKFIFVTNAYLEMEIFYGSFFRL